MKDYFSHDYDARNDPRCVKLRMKMGPDGYGLYWMIVESLYRENGRLKRDYDALAFAMNAKPDRIKMVIEGFDLFYDSDGDIASHSVDKRLAERQERSDKARASVMARYDPSTRTNGYRNTSVDRSNNDRSTIKVNYSKEKEKEIKDVITDSHGESRTPADSSCTWYTQADGPCDMQRVPNSKYCAHHKIKAASKYEKPLKGLPVLKTLPK